MGGVRYLVPFQCTCPGLLGSFLFSAHARGRSVVHCSVCMSRFAWSYRVQCACPRPCTRDLVHCTCPWLRAFLCSTHAWVTLFIFQCACTRSRGRDLVQCACAGSRTWYPFQCACLVSLGRFLFSAHARGGSVVYCAVHMPWVARFFLLQCAYPRLHARFLCSAHARGLNITDVVQC